MDAREYKQMIFAAGEKAVEELIKVAEEAIITDSEKDISADRLKNAAATKKLAIFDAFEILSRINEERNLLIEQDEINSGKRKPQEEAVKIPFAERYSKGK